MQNVVATADFQSKLDLKRIAIACRNAEYNPKRFPAVIVRIREPKATAMIFAKGKVVITGARSEMIAMRAAKMFEKIVGKAMAKSNEIRLTDFTVQNMVATTDVGFCIKLEALKQMHERFRGCHYEPELFPGLIYRVEDDQ